MNARTLSTLPLEDTQEQLEVEIVRAVRALVVRLVGDVYASSAASAALSHAPKGSNMACASSDGPFCTARIR